MSNIERFTNVKQVVLGSELDFNKLAKIHNAVSFEKEASFALQILTDNGYLAQIAMGNQDSLKRAIVNVAAIGLSLNPVHKLAYLVPRDGKVCLDISYLGYIQLATEVGAIKLAFADVVREKDHFEFTGPNREPIHKYNPFGDRGAIVGAYCLAKTHGDEFLCTVMPISEIYSIRDRSQSWKSHIKDGKQTPWKSDESEMIKKTVIKRAWKSWSKSSTREERFAHAIDISNESDPVDFAILPPAKEQTLQSEKDKNLELIRSNLKTLERNEEKFIEHLTRTCKRQIKTLEDLTEIEIDQSLIFLNELVDKKTKKDSINENAG